METFCHKNLWVVHILYGSIEDPSQPSLKVIYGKTIESVLLL